MTLTGGTSVAPGKDANVRRVGISQTLEFESGPKYSVRGWKEVKRKTPPSEASRALGTKVMLKKGSAEKTGGGSHLKAVGPIVPHEPGGGKTETDPGEKGHPV